jgi:hypothetical protein
MKCLITLDTQQWYQQMHVNRPYFKISLYTKFLHSSVKPCGHIQQYKRSNKYLSFVCYIPEYSHMVDRNMKKVRCVYEQI